MKVAVSAEKVFADRGFSPYKPLLAFLLVAVLVVLTGYYVFGRMEKMVEVDKLDDLGAIADMKSGELVAWRNDQRRLGETATHDSMMAVHFEQWLHGGATGSEISRQIEKRLAVLQGVNGYRSIILLDRDGRARISTSATRSLEVNEIGLALDAMKSGEPRFFDFHRTGSGDKDVSIDLIAPLTVAGRGGVRVVGAAVLQIDPYRFLYPLLQSWPMPSPSAETLLVRQDGDDVVYLNDARHKKGIALSLRLPLATPKLPTALAVHGQLETTDGVDYRGVPVVAEMRHVPGSPWFIVSKVDREEIFAPVRRLKAGSMGLGIVFVSIGGLLALVWLQGQKVRYRYMQTQRDAAIERAMLVKQYEYLSRYANDIIIVTDDEGRIVEANERAVESYGYLREELLNMAVPDLRDPAEDPAKFASQIKQCLETGEARYETNGRRRDGTIFPVEVCARLIEVEGIRYIQGIVRDMSEHKQAEEALRKSETLLRKSQQMAHIGSWELDLGSNILYWSEENYRIFEYDPALHHASYEIFLDLVHPDDRAMVDKVYTDSVKNRTPYMIVHRLYFPDGCIKYVREWCETYYDDDGKPLRSIGTTQDITQEHLAQEALRRSAEEIEDLYNNAPCGYHSLDRNGVFLNVNETELHWLGYTREEVIGKMNVKDLLSENSRKAFQERYPSFMEKGYIHDVEYELVSKDGTVIPVSLSATAIRDAEGNFVSNRTTLFDITTRKLAEKKLAESEKRFRTMADNVPIMIWMDDVQEGRRLGNFFNLRWYEFTGLTPGQSRDVDWQDRIHADDRGHYVEAYRDALQERKPFKVEYRLRRHDDVFRWIEDAGVPRFTGDGEFLGFIGICVDVTERKLFEKIRGEMEHMDRLNIAGEMASGLAHELSQPLNAASNYLDVCLRRMAAGNWDHDALQHAVKLAHVQAERAGKIIAHLKEMVRKQKYERVMLDVNAVIKDSVKFVEHELKQCNVTVTLDAAKLPPIEANKIEIEQVLINLIKNAIDSMCCAPVRELRITSRTVESGIILVSVSDTGKGVAAEDMERIFNPFHTSKKDGLGLGLAICRSLVENYGGQIWAEQKEGAGMEFNFTLGGTTYD
jgi:PAS domain S-box-containing protein